jgi:hypothetical protein
MTTLEGDFSLAIRISIFYGVAVLDLALLPVKLE